MEVLDENSLVQLLVVKIFLKKLRRNHCLRRVELLKLEIFNLLLLLSALN
jgi:hypothetical protein